MMTKKQMLLITKHSEKISLQTDNITILILQIDNNNSKNFTLHENSTLYFIKYISEAPFKSYSITLVVQ